MNTKKHHPPSVSETAFECPHCGAYTTQQWSELSSSVLSGERRTPTIPGADVRASIEKEDIEEKVKSSLLAWADKMALGKVFFETSQQGRYLHRNVQNLHISECFNCKDVAVWVHSNMVFPLVRDAAQPNQDLPPDIMRDYEEARGVIIASPRGAAALLRLCIQKLCAHLGESGKDINKDISRLVAKGLNPLVQKSLDVVRVVGNEAVHPGVLDLRDDRDTALQLFTLVNIVADQMISHPKAIESMYERLPASKRDAIEKRDASIEKGGA